MESIFLFGLLFLSMLIGSFEEGIFCQYNRNMYHDKWRHGNKANHAIDEFDIVADTDAPYYWMKYTVVWKITGKKVLFPATCIGSNTIVGRPGNFINADSANLFIKEFYMNGNNTTEYKGIIIYKLFKHDANSHHTIPYGNIFYIFFNNGKRFYNKNMDELKKIINNSTE